MSTPKLVNFPIFWIPGVEKWQGAVASLATLSDNKQAHSCSKPWQTQE